MQRRRGTIVIVTTSIVHVVLLDGEPSGKFARPNWRSFQRRNRSAQDRDPTNAATWRWPTLCRSQLWPRGWRDARITRQPRRSLFLSSCFHQRLMHRRNQEPMMRPTQMEAVWTTAYCPDNGDGFLDET